MCFVLEETKVPCTIFSWSVVLLLITIAIAAVVGVIVYRISIQTVLYFTLSDNQTLTSMVSLTTSVTAALLNLVCIMTFNLIYRRIATFLTELGEFYLFLILAIPNEHRLFCMFCSSF
ncbi:uncharacterized protein LOC143242146 [Tachypleus tridentatus]|uniref:uncharacterized protein LOC143242146 n=1 Tax=Tachypleus tridentatus TaxID=6853 RepID=UPI003FD3B260